MKSKIIGAVELLGAFVAGMIIDLQLFSQIPLAHAKELAGGEGRN